MKQTKLTIFDDHLGSDSTLVVGMTSDQHAKILGMFDQVAVCLTAEQIAGANPTIAVQMYHSGDGIHWLPKSATAEIPTAVLDPNTTNPRVGFDDGTVPTLRFVRFVITVQTIVAGFEVAVRLDAILNDTRDNAFARQMQHMIDKQEDMNKCDHWLQGGSSVREGDPLYYAALAAEQATSKNPHPVASELHCSWHESEGGADPSETRCQLAADAAVCVGADGSSVISSPRGRMGVPSFVASGNGDQGC